MVLKLSAEYRNQSSLQRTQKAVRLIMRVLYRHEAAFKHFAQMGNGGIVVTAFGLPPFTMSIAACAQRACSAGTILRTKLLEIGVQCTVGVSSGTCCIGTVPGVERIATVLLGKPVALATQMANACTARRPMIMDDICFQANKTNYNCESLRALHRRGASGADGMAGVKLLMLFALESMKPVRVEKTLTNSKYEV